MQIGRCAVIAGLAVEAWMLVFTVVAGVQFMLSTLA